MTMYKIYNGECLEVMDKLIEEGVKVDCILTDPPYGTTACKWDSAIPFDKMWEGLNKLIKPNGAIVLFGSEPFSSALRMSNIKNYKYDLVWGKERPSNPALAKKRPLKYTEYIHLFYNKQSTYNPQMTKRLEQNKRNNKNEKFSTEASAKLGDSFKKTGMNDYCYPKDFLRFNTQRGLHPTQKPVDLLEYLIKTYTSEGEIVLDFTMGSGSCGVACMNTNRKFIGIELDKNYFDIASKRIEEAYFNAQNKEGAINGNE